MKNFSEKNDRPISRRQFLRQATSTTAGLIVGSSLAQGITYKGKTHKFSTGSDWDVTFFAIGDTHYGWGQTIVYNELTNKAKIDHMNYIPGNLAYPGAPYGGIVAEPRGVLIAGDLTASGKTDQWEGFDAVDGFEDDYLGSGSTPGRLKWPVYEGFGNHDTAEISGFSDYARDQMKSRTVAGERPGTFDVSDNGYHYSWTWENIHFVNLNLYPGAIGTDAKGSLEFLISDLAKNIGNSGKAVVLYHHYDFLISYWWQEREMDAYYEAIKDYNIIAIIYGHTHITNFESSTWRGINTFNVGLAGTEKFAVFQITKNRLFAGECVNNTTWGNTFTKNIITL